MSIVVYSRFECPPRKFAPVGDGTTPTYEEVFENGHYQLKISGKDNLFDFVQASKEETLVYNIIDRYRRGDVNALNQRIGQYMDVVGMPSNLIEARKVLFDVEKNFNNLSPDIRKNFDNDVNVFIDVVSHADADKLRSYFGVSADQVKNVKEDDVNVNV